MATSGPVSEISIGALRELLAQDLLGALGEIGGTIEQADEGEVPHRLVGQQGFLLRGGAVAGAGVPDGGAQQLLCDGAQSPHLVGIELVHHPVALGDFQPNGAGHGRLSTASDVDFVAVTRHRLEPGSQEMAGLARAHADTVARFPRPHFDGVATGLSAWFPVYAILGVSRLHHLLATGTMTSKCGAGRYARDAFDPCWQPIIAESLSLRTAGAEGHRSYRDPLARRRDTLAFVDTVIETALALPA